MVLPSGATSTCASVISVVSNAITRVALSACRMLAGNNRSSGAQVRNLKVFMRLSALSAGSLLTQEFFQQRLEVATHVDFAGVGDQFPVTAQQHVLRHAGECETRQDIL